MAANDTDRLIDMLPKLTMDDLPNRIIDDAILGGEGSLGNSSGMSRSNISDLLSRKFALVLTTINTKAVLNCHSDIVLVGPNHEVPRVKAGLVIADVHHDSGFRNNSIVNFICNAMNTTSFMAIVDLAVAIGEFAIGPINAVIGGLLDRNHQEFSAIHCTNITLKLIQWQS